MLRAVQVSSNVPIPARECSLRFLVRTHSSRDVTIKFLLFFTNLNDRAIFCYWKFSFNYKKKIFKNHKKNSFRSHIFVSNFRDVNFTIIKKFLDKLSNYLTRWLNQIKELRICFFYILLIYNEVNQSVSDDRSAENASEKHWKPCAMSQLVASIRWKIAETSNARSRAKLWKIMADAR